MKILDKDKHVPYIKGQIALPEVTIKAVVVGVILAVIFTMSSLYIGLKFARTVAASIPAALLSLMIFKAFKKTTILGYELPWNNRTFRTDVFIKLSREDLDLKFKMLDCYKTQGERVFMGKEYIYDIARTRGLQIGKKYAEAYEAIRIVI